MPVALLAEGVDRNPQLAEQGVVDDLSPSSQRAWIEIPRRRRRWCCRWVALLAEGVDRNIIAQDNPQCSCVALLAEGVDRNCTGNVLEL